MGLNILDTITNLFKSEETESEETFDIKDALVEGFQSTMDKFEAGNHAENVADNKMWEQQHASEYNDGLGF